MRIFIILCLVCTLASCSSPKKEVLPARLSADSVISRNEMINILVDVHLVEASLNFERNRGGNITLMNQNYYQWVWRKYHLTLHRFRDNLNYYMMDSGNFSKMYEEVLKKLTDRSKEPAKPGKK